MYNVSNAYLTAINKPAKIRRLTGTIGSVAFSDENISYGSFNIENQCSSESEVQIGSVYMGVLTATFREVNLKGQWKKKNITPAEGLLIGYDNNDDPIFEDVPLGVYTVYEANYQDDGVAVTAYDNMKKLDKKFSLASTIGTPYDILLMIATDCKVTLAQTEQQIRALPNGTKSYTLFSENDIETYRDLLSWVAQTTCTFATINRTGQLELRQYGDTPVDTIGATVRFTGASFSDFETYYTGVSVVNIDKETTIYVGEETDDGLTYNLGSNPLLQSGNVQTSLQAILEGLQVIQYSPFSISRAAMPAYDLGDVIAFEDNNGEGKVGCLMSFEYTYHGPYVMEGFGKNPALADARSKTDKEIAGLMKNNGISNAINYYTYTNASPIDIHDDYKEIIRLRFGAQKDTIVVFHAEIKLNAEITDEEVDAVIGNIKYLFNNVEVDYHPRETWIEGTHLLHLLYYFPLEGASLNNLSVRMNTDGFVHIDRMSIQASVSGQGLVATYQWDGYLEFEETVYHKDFCNEPGSVDAITDTPTVELVDVITLEFAEDMSPVEFSNEPENIEPIDATPYINKRRLKDLTWGEVKQYTWGEIKELFLW